MSFGLELHSRLERYSPAHDIKPFDLFDRKTIIFDNILTIHT